MKEKVNEIKSRIKIDLNVDDLNILNDIKTKYIGKKGIITELSSMLKEVPSEERKSFGMMLNEVKTLFNDTYEKCGKIKKGSLIKCDEYFSKNNYFTMKKYTIL